MRVIYMGRKPAASNGLRYLISRGIEVVAVVAPPKSTSVHWSDRLVDTAENSGIPTVQDTDLYEILSGKKKQSLNLANIDLVISFLFWKRIKKPLLNLGKMGCINFHPAPLPEFRGVTGYSFAIYENLSQWGASAHFVDESFDTGDLIKVNRFNMNPETETAFSLEQKTQQELLTLFKETIDLVLETKTLPRKQQGSGRYINKEEFNRIRQIHPDDNAETVKRKIRAFWYPPFDGASIIIDGQEFTLVDQALLQEIGKKYHDK